MPKIKAKSKKINPNHMKRSPGSNIPRPSLFQSLLPFAKRTPNPTKNGIAKPAEIIGQLTNKWNYFASNLGSVTTLDYGP